jgi:hypothetical protein
MARKRWVRIPQEAIYRIAGATTEDELPVCSSLLQTHGPHPFNVSSRSKPSRRAIVASSLTHVLLSEAGERSR